MLNKINVYQLMIATLFVLAISAILSDPAFTTQTLIDGLIPIGIVVFAAGALDLIITWYKHKRIMLPKSAIISGLFIGTIASVGQALWLYAIAGVVAVVFKHLLQYHKKNIFNPAISAMLLVGLALGMTISWWSSSFTYLVIPLVALVIYKLKRFKMVIPFLVTYFGLSAGLLYLQGSVELITFLLTGGITYFFLLVLIDPKTTPISVRGRQLFAVLVAVLMVVMENSGIAFLSGYSIFLAIIIANVLTPFVFNRLGKNV